MHKGVNRYVLNISTIQARTYADPNTTRLTLKTSMDLLRDLPRVPVSLKLSPSRHFCIPCSDQQKLITLHWEWPKGPVVLISSPCVDLISSRWAAGRCISLRWVSNACFNISPRSRCG
jgi:hypothetical protein